MNLKAVRGDHNVYQVTALRQNAPVNLAGGKMWFTAKADNKAGDTTAVIKLDSVANPTQVVPVLGITGKFQVQLRPVDTETLAQDAYYYDIQIREFSGIITTIASGTLHIVEDVTKTSA